MTIFKKWKLRLLLKKVRKLHKQQELSTGSDVQGEVNALLNLAKFYDTYSHHKKFPRAKCIALEYYRAAAKLGNAGAQYVCAQRFMEKGKFWEAWGNDIYGDTIHKKYASDRYAEAFQYLKAAEDNGFALAKRLHGLACIHGWGVEKDPKTGFQYILDSIEMENAWNRATKILEELKLSSPEFFKTLMEYKASKGQSN